MRNCILFIESKLRVASQKGFHFITVNFQCACLITGFPQNMPTAHHNNF